MLLANARVLDRHLPAGEGNESRASGDMAVEEGGTAKLLRGGNHAATLATAAAWRHPHGATLKGLESANSVPSLTRIT